MARVNGGLSLRQRIDAALRRLGAEVAAVKADSEYQTRETRVRIDREARKRAADLSHVDATIRCLVVSLYAPTWRERRSARKILREWQAEGK